MNEDSRRRYDFTKEAEETDEELSKELEKLMVLSDDEVAALLPNRADQDQLKDLIEAVRSAATVNRKKAVLLERLAGVSEVVKEVVKGIVKAAAASPMPF
jgi:hypothetical protein